MLLFTGKTSAYVFANAQGETVKQSGSGTVSFVLEYCYYCEKSHNVPTVTGYPEGYFEDGGQVTFRFGNIPNAFGDYTIHADFAETDNFLPHTASALFTVIIGQGHGEVTMNNWTFGQAPPNPVSNGHSASVTYEYFDGVLSLGATPPVNAGMYTLRATFGTTLHYRSFMAEITFTINKAPGFGEVTIAGWTFGQAPFAPSPIGGHTAQVSYEYFDGAVSLGATPPTNAGTYTVRGIFAEGANHLAHHSDAVEFTINKATGFGTITITDWVFGQAPSNPSHSGHIESVTFEYRDSQGTLLPNRPVNAGTYTVVGIFAESENHLAHHSGAVEFTITRAAGVFSGDISLNSFTASSFELAIHANVVTCENGLHWFNGQRVQYAASNTEALPENAIWHDNSILPTGFTVRQGHVYYVFVRLLGDNNHYYSEITMIVVRTTGAGQSTLGNVGRGGNATLSDGAIGGIVAGGCVTLLGLGGLVWVFIRRGRII